MNNIKYTIPFLLAFLIIPIGIVYAQEMPREQEPVRDVGNVNENIDEDSNIALYDLLFPETDIANEIKEKIIDNMLNSEAIDAPTPINQKELGEKAVQLINDIKSSTDEEIVKNKQRMLNEMTVPLLRAGIVVAEKYEQDPLVWKKLLEGFEQEGSQDIRTVSHRIYDYQVGVKYFYECHNSLLLCRTNWIYSSVNEGDLVSPPTATLPPYATSGGGLEFSHQVKYIGGHPPQRETVDSWVSVRSGSSWVANCHEDHTFTWRMNYQSHAYIVCSTDESGAGRTIYSSIGIDL